MAQKKVTIYDIAKRTGLSVATISRVLNNSDDVKRETKEYVNKVIKEMNYVPNAIARSLKNKKTSSIGILVYAIDSPFFSELIASIEDFFTNKDYHILLATISGSAKSEIDLLNFLVKKEVEGIMLLGSYNDKNIYEELERISKKIPIILVGDYIDLETIYSVNSDNLEGAYKAVKYLIDLGHRDIGILTGYKGQYDSEERLKGYKKALLEAGIEFNPNYVFPGDYSVEKCQNGIVQFIERNSKITALFAVSDMMAIGAMTGLLQHDYKVPDDISIMGFDNIKNASFVYPSLSTVDQRIKVLGRLAASLMIEALNSEKSYPQRVINKTNLIIRDSTGYVNSDRKRG